MGTWLGSKSDRWREKFVRDVVTSYLYILVDGVGVQCHGVTLI